MSRRILKGTVPSRFIRNEDGSMTIFSVMMVVLILVLTGSAVDIMRHEAVRAHMQGTLDRAVLAATDLDQQRPSAEVVADYLARAGLSHTSQEIDVAQSASDRLVTARTRDTLDTVFLRMLGYDTLDVSVIAAAHQRVSQVEISLALDISGSMRFNNRMDRMKPAATDFVNKVMSGSGAGMTTVNLVPFAGHVNPGDLLFDYFRGERPPLPGNSASAGTSGDGADPDHFPAWAQAISNIVMYFDLDGDDIFDVAHKIESFPDSAPRDVDAFMKGAVGYAMAQDRALRSVDQFLGISIKGGNEKTRYFQVKGDRNGPESDLGPTSNTGKIPGETYAYGQIDFAHHAAHYDALSGPAPQEATQPVNMPSSCIEVEQDEFHTTAMPRSTNFVPHFHYWPIDEVEMDWGWCPEEDTVIQYYSSDADALAAFIRGLRMHDGTGLHIAAKYALALLDPENRAALGHLIDHGLVDPAFHGRPMNWDDTETAKYMVIMTDGQTTDQIRPTHPTAAINGEVELQEQGSGSHYVSASRADNIDALLRQCDLAKSLGVTVFTIAYETSASAADDMRRCASSVGHFFHVEGEDIAVAFDAVARQINNLRLVQ